jgi:hypothetical protein
LLARTISSLSRAHDLPCLVTPEAVVRESAAMPIPPGLGTRAFQEGRA